MEVLMEHMYDSVKLFENTIAEYAGSKYAIAVDSGTNAIFLCCKYLKVQEVTIPSQSFCSIAAATLHAGGDLKFRDYEWSGRFQLEPYPIWDSAGRFHRGMYIDDSHYCLSFHANKHLKIGKGGMILTNDKNAAKWFNLARYYGMQDAYSDEPGKIVMAGWNMIMTPDMASRGLMLMNKMPDHNEDLNHPYPDLSILDIYEKEQYEMANNTPA
jgi:dTDP-4-amino-4,6-dideoxygalactose transaminase